MVANIFDNKRGSGDGKAGPAFGVDNTAVSLRDMSLDLTLEISSPALQHSSEMKPSQWTPIRGQEINVKSSI